MDHDGVSPRHGRRLAGPLTSVHDQDLASEAIADYRPACLTRAIRALGRRHEAGKHPHGSRFPCSVGTQDADDLAFFFFN